MLHFTAAFVFLVGVFYTFPFTSHYVTSAVSYIIASL